MSVMTPMQELADLKLGGLDEFVKVRRARGDAWRIISRDIHDAVGLDVSIETLRSWYPDTERAS